MKIVKNDHTGQPVWEYEGQCLVDTPRALLYEARFNRSYLIFEGVYLRKGDRFLELFPRGRWFNIFEIHDKDSDQIKAWYCNVTRPAVVDGDVISYDDLALDVLAYPDDRYRVLDRDEFELLEIPTLDQKAALQGLKELEEIFSAPEPFLMVRFENFI